MKSTYLEEAWEISQNQIFGGSFTGELPAEILIELYSDKFRFSCTSCKGSICIHLLSLVDLYLKSPSSFYKLSAVDVDLTKIGKANWQTHLVKTAPSKNLTALRKKLVLMREGVSFAQSLIVELFQQIPKVSTSEELYDLNIQVDRLSEFSLAGIRARLREVLMKNTDVLSGLATVMKGLKLSEGVLREQLSDDSLSYINSEVYTYLGHVWKTVDLEVLNKPQQGVLIPLYFHSYENVYFERLEDVQVWFCLNSMKVCFTQTLRPFKSLRHLKKQKESLDVMESNDVCFYPGKYFPRIRYKSAISRSIKSDDLSTILNRTSLLDNSMIRDVKKQLTNPLCHYAPVILCKMSSLFQSGELAFLEGEGEQKFSLENCHSTEVLCSMTSLDLEGAGLLLSFSYLKGLVVGRPLALINSLGITRLSL
ncbi:MAG: hypothetical protein NE330_01010 [Lentisphaeraceae bacterium]|nr:hypothetical protein [Lentisphaeraceae bacterium]